MAVTYQQVEAAANELVAAGVHPGNRKVYDKVGGGASMAVFSEHLRTWRQNKPTEQTATPQLSPSLVTALMSEINKTAASVKTELEQQLRDTQADYDVVIAECKTVEADLVQAKQEFSELAAEHERTVVTLEHAKADFENASASLVIKTSEAETARKAEAVAVVNADNARAQVQEKQATIQDLLRQLEDSHGERRALSENLAVKTSEVVSTLQRLEDARAQSADLAARIKVLEAKLQSEQEGRSAAQAAAAAADARALAATAQAEEREKRVVDLQKLASADRDARVIAEKELSEFRKAAEKARVSAAA